MDESTQAARDLDSGHPAEGTMILAVWRVRKHACEGRGGRRCRLRPQVSVGTAFRRSAKGRCDLLLDLEAIRIPRSGQEYLGSVVPYRYYFATLNSAVVFRRFFV